MPLSLVMGEFKSLLQSWGRHILEDLKRREFFKAASILPRRKERSPEILCALPERFPNAFCFNKETASREHVQPVSCYRQKEFFLLMVNPQLLSQCGFIATKSSLLMVKGSSWVGTIPPLYGSTWAELVRCRGHTPQRISYPYSDHQWRVVAPWALSTLVQRQGSPGRGNCQHCVSDTHTSRCALCGFCQTGTWLPSKVLEHETNVYP